jgi:hypothetical protein
MKRLAMFAAAVALCAGSAFAGEKAVMHCFAFSTIEKATPEEWAAFKKETDALPGKINGLKRVWHGKLARPLAYNNAAIPDEAARKTYRENKKGTGISANITRVERQHGVCMEFADMAAFQAYGKDPAHDAWVKAYEKVRIAGTTTYQIQGE